MIDQEEQENIEQVENAEANTQEEENVSLQQPQDQTQDVVEEESAPEATSSAPEATSSAPQLTPLQYVINNYLFLLFYYFTDNMILNIENILIKKDKKVKLFFNKHVNKLQVILKIFMKITKRRNS